MGAIMEGGGGVGGVPGRAGELGRGSGRGRVEIPGAADSLKKKTLSSSLTSFDLR